MLNRIVLMGRLTRDPELRRTQSGTCGCSFSACLRPRLRGAGRGAGNRLHRHRRMARIQPSLSDKYFSKGRMIVVAGRLADPQLGRQGRQ